MALTEDSIGEQVIEDEFEKRIAQDLASSSEAFETLERQNWGATSPSWKLAEGIVKKVKPIPWLFWIMIRGAWGKGEIDFSKIDPGTFSLVENLVIRASRDLDISRATKESSLEVGHALSFYEALKISGADTIASLCFIHSVCKRVSTFLSERIYRAIIDDALMRARLGLILAKYSPKISRGMGLLAGFSGRAGLAIQLASGTDEQARLALSGLAMGKDISTTGEEVYNCDPLQVVSLSLISGGCSKDIANGIASYSMPMSKNNTDNAQYVWLACFSVIEKLRLNSLESIQEDYLKYLEIEPSQMIELKKEIQITMRNGHKLSWLTLNLSQMLES